MSLRSSPTRLIGILWLAAVVTAADAAGAQVQPSSDAATIISLHLAYADSAAGRERYRSGDSVVFVARTPVLSDADFLSVRPSGGRSGGMLLRVECRPEVGQRLRSIAQDHVGGYGALFVAGRLEGVMVIASPISCESLVIRTNQTGEVASRTLGLVRTKWPRQ